MNTLVVLVLCFVAVNAYRPMGPLVGDGPPGARVVGGKPATADQAPFQIGLFATSWFGSSLICGGSLIGTRAAITAAHCCDGQQASQLVVQYDGLDRTTLKTKNQVTKIEKHENYNSNTIENDLCVLVLQNAVVESNTVKKIALVDAKPAEGVVADLTGWGKTSGSSSALPTLLQYVQMTILSNEKCNSKWSDVNAITVSMICAENSAASGCNGDSGGPLVVDKKLAGVVSWGANGCPPDTTVRPTVYGDVDNGRIWIIGKMNSNNAN